LMKLTSPAINGRGG